MFRVTISVSSLKSFKICIGLGCLLFSLNAWGLKAGQTAPDFTLKDTITGRVESLNQLKSKKGTVIMFICNHCPFVKHVRKELVNIANDYQKKGIAFVAISSNDVSRYPEDGPENMKKIAKKFHYPFPYLYDESQSVVKAYKVVRTPEIFVLDGKSKLVYHGQIDNSAYYNNLPVTGETLREVLDGLLSGKAIAFKSREDVGGGCTIKWK